MRTLIILALASLAVEASAQDVRGAEKALTQAIKTQNQKELETAVTALLNAHSLEAMKALLAAAAKGPTHEKKASAEDAWWTEAYILMLNSAASFNDPAPLGELGEFIVKNKTKPISRDAMAMVANHGQKPIVAVCLKVLEGGTDDLKIMAVDHLAAIGDKTVVEALVKALKANEKSPGDLKTRIGRALTLFTGQDYGDNVTNWEGWYANNKDKEWETKKSEGSSGSSGTVTDAMDRLRMTEFELLKKKGKVLVLQAGTGCKCGKNHDLDNIDAVTTKMGLTTETINKVDFDKRDDLKLEDYVAILANCTHIREHCVCPLCKPGAYSKDRLFQCVCPENKHENVQYKLGEKGVQKIKKYVENGGYLFAEDWCMEDFVAKAFGDYVIHGSVRSKDETVAVLPKPTSVSHPYLKKIFFKPPVERTGTISETDLEKLAHNWKIDKETRTIKVRDPQKVVTLLTSPELEKTAGGDDAVAVTFAVTPADVKTKGSSQSQKDTATGGAPVSQDRKLMQGGRVLYVLSHFGKQESTADEYSLQNLLINFLVEANERRGSYAPKR